jgi:hypothetical protein
MLRRLAWEEVGQAVSMVPSERPIGEIALMSDAGRVNTADVSAESDERPHRRPVIQRWETSIAEELSSRAQVDGVPQAGRK